MLCDFIGVYVSCLLPNRMETLAGCNQSLDEGSLSTESLPLVSETANPKESATSPTRKSESPDVMFVVTQARTQSVNLVENTSNPSLPLLEEQSADPQEDSSALLGKLGSFMIQPIIFLTKLGCRYC